MEPGKSSSAGVDFTAVLPHDLIQNHIIARLDKPAKTALLRVSKACFGLTVAGVKFPTSKTLMPLFGPALRHLSWPCPDSADMKLSDYVEVVEKCLVPIRLTFDFMYVVLEMNLLLFLALLDRPMVKELHVRHFEVINEDALAVLAHPKFVVGGGYELEFGGDLPLSSPCLTKLAALPNLNAIFFTFRPLRVHHLDLLDLVPDCVRLNIAPKGAAADVLASAERLARLVVRKNDENELTFEYETEADLRILSRILQEHGRPADGDHDYHQLTIKSNWGGPLSQWAVENEFLDALRGVSVEHYLDVNFGAEIRPEFAIEALASAFELHCSVFCNVRIACCTPQACERARALLRVNNTPDSRITIAARPRADGTGPTTDAWMWDAMAHASVRADGSSSLVLYGGCDDSGCRGGRQARRAGRAMGRTDFDNITVIFRCPDTAWMAPFIRGFVLTTGVYTRKVTLMAGKLIDVEAGDDEYEDGVSMRSVLRPEVVAAVNAAGPVEYVCLETIP